MDKKPTVLLVDDDFLLQTLVQDILGPHYDIITTSTGAAGVAAAQASQPEVVLMDILMTDMTGYDACAAIKALPECADIPVIFLSGLTEPEDRLRAYEVGGSDFLAKPFTPTELINKVGSVIQTRHKHRELADSAQNAFQVAMTAMTSASEQGTVLQFVTRAMQAQDAESLGRATLETAAAYGLTASIQLRGTAGTVSMNACGPSSPLEAAVLSNLSTCGRIVRFGPRYAFNDETVTLLVTDMPVDDDSRCGRLRDHLIVMAEVAHARLVALNMQIRLAASQEKLLDLFDRAQTLLSRIDRRSTEQREQSARALQGMLDRMEDAFLYLGLTETQEETVARMLKDAVEESQRCFLPDPDEAQAVGTLLADMRQLAAQPGR